MANGTTSTVPAATAPAFSSAPLPQPNVPITGTSPGMLQLQAALAQKMLEQGIDYSPIRSPWQGAARVADAIFGGMAMRDLNRQYLQGQAQAGAALGAGMGALGGGGGGGTGGATATGGGGGGKAAVPASAAEVDQFTRDTAKSLGIDPDIASNFVKVESAYGQNSIGDNGTSFGPLQLHYSGKGAMGDNFTHDTGLDARDLSTWRQQIRYGLTQAAKGGWAPWQTTMNRLGYQPFTGIGGGGGGYAGSVVRGAPGGTAVAANQPSVGATAEEATTASPGGGFVLPGVAPGETGPRSSAAVPPSGGPGMGYPALNLLPPVQPGTPAAIGARAAFGDMPVSGQTQPGSPGPGIGLLSGLPSGGGTRSPAPAPAQPSPAGAGGLPPKPVLTDQPAPPGATKAIMRDGVAVWGDDEGNAITASGAKLPPEATSSPARPLGDNTPIGGGGAGNVMQAPTGTPAAAVQGTEGGGSPVGQPNWRDFALGQAVMGGPAYGFGAGAPPGAAAAGGAIPPGTTAVAPPRPVPAPAGAVPQGATVYQGRTQLGMPGQPGQLAPTPGGAALSPQQGGSLLDAIGQAFGGVGNAVGGLFRGGGPAPGQGGAAGGTIPPGATALAPGAQGAQSGAQPAGGMSAAVGYAMQVINSPYATEAQKQIAIAILNRSMTVGQVIDIGKDPNTGYDRKAIYNPTTGQITPLDPTTGLPVAAGGAAPAGGGGAAPAADGGAGATKGWAGPEELDAGQKADWNKIMAQPTGDVGELLIGPRPAGMTNPDYQGAVKKAIGDERGKLEDQLKNGPGFSSYSNSVAAWNSMLASAANAKPSSGVDIVRAFNKIMAPNSPRGISSDDLKEAFESAGIPTEVWERGKAAIFGNSPMSAETRKALIEVAQNRINTYRSQYGDEAVSIGEKAHMLGISPQLILPGRMRMNSYDESKVVEPQDRTTPAPQDPRPPAAIKEGVPQNATPQSDGSFTWPDPDHPGKIKRWRP